MATTCKLLRQTDYQQNSYAGGSSVVQVFGVRYEGALTEPLIILAGETADHPDGANTTATPVPPYNGSIFGLPVVQRTCRKLSNAYALVTVRASDATYFGGGEFDGRPRSATQTRFIPFRIPHIMVDAGTGISSVHYYDTRRMVSTRVYSAVAGSGAGGIPNLTVDDIHEILEPQSEKVFAFPSGSKSIFVGGTVRPFQDNFLMTTLTFERTAPKKLFPLNAFGTGSQVVPALPALADYGLTEPLTFVGPPLNPISVIAVPYTTWFDDGDGLAETFNPLGFTFAY